MADYVAPILTLPQARALLAAAGQRALDLDALREQHEHSTWTRGLYRERESLLRSIDELERVLGDRGALTPDPAAPGTPTSEGTS